MTKTDEINFKIVVLALQGHDPIEALRMVIGREAADRIILNVYNRLRAEVEAEQRSIVYLD